MKDIDRIELFDEFFNSLLIKYGLNNGNTMFSKGKNLEMKIKVRKYVCFVNFKIEKEILKQLKNFSLEQFWGRKEIGYRKIIETKVDEIYGGWPDYNSDTGSKRKNRHNIMKELKNVTKKLKVLDIEIELTNGKHYN